LLSRIKIVKQWVYSAKPSSRVQISISPPHLKKPVN